MNNKEVFLKDYRDRLKQARKVGKKMFIERMVAQNIRDIIPGCWKIEYMGYVTGLHISPINKDASLVEEFVKLTKKLAKTFQKEPYMNVDKEQLNASFYCYLGFNKEFSPWESVLIDVFVGNSEKCDIIVTKTMEEVEHQELTGYCKVLKEKKFLEENNN